MSSVVNYPDGSLTQSRVLWTAPHNSRICNDGSISCRCFARCQRIHVQSLYICACQIIYYIRALYSSATVRQVARCEIVRNEASSSTFDLVTPFILIRHSSSLELFHFNLIISSLNISLINFSTSLTFTSKCIFREKFSI